jgi:hypothetical protein
MSVLVGLFSSFVVYYDDGTIDLTSPFGLFMNSRAMIPFLLFSTVQISLFPILTSGLSSVYEVRWAFRLRFLSHPPTALGSFAGISNQNFELIVSGSTIAQTGNCF